MPTDAASEFLAGFLAPQVRIGTDSAADREAALSRLNDRWALGYVYGSFDLTCQVHGIRHESADGVDLLMGLLRYLYGAVAEQRFQEIVKLQSDEEFCQGGLAGGNEALRAASGETTGILGLGRHVRGEGRSTENVAKNPTGDLEEPKNRRTQHSTSVNERATDRADQQEPPLAPPHPKTPGLAERRFSAFLLIAAVAGLLTYFLQDRQSPEPAPPRLRVVGQPVDLSPIPVPKPAPTSNATVQALMFDPHPVAVSTGVVWARPGLPRVAPLEIRASPDSDFFVKLMDMGDEPALKLYVEGGRKLATEAPLGTYELRYAVGDTWYGEENDRLFGPAKPTYRADRLFTFERHGDEVSGYTVELILQEGGNLGQIRIPRSEF